MNTTECQAEPATVKPSPLAKRAIFFDGPYAKPDPKQEGDEMPFWTVFVGFAETGDAVRPIYEVNDFKRAQALAQAMATDRQIELIADATPA
jgi:hypothetical protein